MPNRKNNNSRKESKKMFRQQVEERLSQVLIEVKDVLGEKKFGRRIQKAGKLLTKGISRKALDNLQKQLPTTHTDTTPTEEQATTIQDLP